MERFTKPTNLCFRLLSPLSLSLISFLIFIIVSTLILISYVPLRINLSGSMPVGIYHVSSHFSLARGDLVEVCLPYSLAKFAKSRGYVGTGSCALHTEPLLKEIIAIAGDTVCVTTFGVWVNHKLLPHSVGLIRDSHHRSLSSFQGCYTLKSHQLWLYGNNSIRSFDSRYFGAMDDRYVIATVKPFITFKRN